MIRLPADVEDELGQAVYSVLDQTDETWAEAGYGRRQEFVDAAVAVVGRLLDPDRHVYLSTHCLHGKHNDCGQVQRARGDLTDPHCKGCPSRCLCFCHGSDKPKETT